MMEQLQKICSRLYRFCWKHWKGGKIVDLGEKDLHVCGCCCWFVSTKWCAQRGLFMINTNAFTCTYEHFDPGDFALPCKHSKLIHNTTRMCMYHNIIFGIYMFMYYICYIWLWIKWYTIWCCCIVSRTKSKWCVNFLK